jgi:zinc transport system substrate-binding protein
MLDARPARMMIFEGEPHPEAKSRLRSLGVHTVVFAPSANRPESGDWLSAMQSNAERVRAATARNES